MHAEVTMHFTRMQFAARTGKRVSGLRSLEHSSVASRWLKEATKQQTATVSEDCVSQELWACPCPSDDAESHRNNLRLRVSKERCSPLYCDCQTFSKSTSLNFAAAFNSGSTATPLPTTLSEEANAGHSKAPWRKQLYNA